MQTTKGVARRAPARRRSIGEIGRSRWAVYVTAGAATALGGVGAAEADIIYSGPVDHTFNAPPGHASIARFPLDQPGNVIGGDFFRLSPNKGAGLFFVGAAPSGSEAAIASFAGNGFAGFQYASKLSFGQNISTRPFVPGYGRLAIPIGNEGIGVNAQWQQPGTGFVGFEFNGGNGLQYGWARGHADGQPGNTFTLIDYAFADPGEEITAGETGNASVPESGGSLGLLALGCAGLLAWRTVRKSGTAA